MVIDRAPADTAINGDVLAWKAGQDEVEDLSLVVSSNWQRVPHPFPMVQTMLRWMRLIELMPDVAKKIFASEWHFDAVHSSGLQRLNGHRHATTTSNHKGMTYDLARHLSASAL
jgi:hypothetical protein